MGKVIVKAFVYVIGAIAGLILFLTPFYVYGWMQHTANVQVWVANSVDDFREDDIDWREFHFDTDPEVTLNQIRNVIIENSSLFRSDAFRAENQEYMNVLYDMIAVLVNTPDDRKEMNRLMVNAIVTQQAFYDAHERFQSSTLYAMRFTF